MLGALIASEAFGATVAITSRDGGGGDLYIYGMDGAVLKMLKGNGLENGQGMAVRSNGNLLVGNEGGNNVLEYTPGGAFVGAFATYTPGPQPVVFGPDGNLYVSGAGVVNQYDGQTGAFLKTFASGNTAVTGLAFDAKGNLFTGDGVSGKVKEFDSTGAFVRQFTAPLLASGTGALLMQGDTLLVSAVFDTTGYAWGNAILKFDLLGNYLGLFASGANLDGPLGMAWGPDGNLWVVNYHGNSVVRFTSSGQFVDTFLANTEGSAPTFIAFLDSADAGEPASTATPEPGTVGMVAVGVVAAVLRKSSKEDRR